MFEPCPCGGATYLACCARLHSGQMTAPDAETVMRARYSAYVRGDVAYLLRSWSKTTRPTGLEIPPGDEWIGLAIDGVDDARSDAATVRFTAKFRRSGRPRVLRETSRFIREDGAWVYLDGVVG